MAARNGNNTANGIISFIVVACGITFSALIGCILKKAVDSSISALTDSGNDFGISDTNVDSTIAYASAPLWSFGFSYIVPGIIGIISTFVRHKGAYITQMVFCIITLLVMGAFFIFAFFGLGVLMTLNPSTETCSNNVQNKCTCTDSDVSLDYSCEDMRSMYGMAIGIMLMVVLGWILTLVITILSGILACRQETQPGVVLQRQPMTTTVVQLAPVAGIPPQVNYMPAQTGYMPQQIGYAPQTNDQAQLVHNMEY